MTIDELRSQRAAVIGFGSIGRRHAANLKKLGYRVDVVSESQSIPPSVGMEVALSEISGDTHAFAIIANRNDLHLATAMELTGRGVNLLIEKPLAQELNEVEAFIELLAVTGTICQTAFVLRQNPCLTYVRNILEGGTLGRVYGSQTSMGSYLPDWRPAQDYARTTSARSGVVLDMAHEFDYLALLFGPFLTVQAQCAVVSDLETVGDWADIIYRTKHVHGSLHLDFLQRQSVRRTTIVGKRGTLEMDLVNNKVSLHDEKGSRILFMSDHAPNDLYMKMLKSFEEAVRTSDTGMNDLREAARTLRTALACLQASEQMTSIVP